MDELKGMNCELPLAFPSDFSILLAKTLTGGPDERFDGTTTPIK